MSKVEWVDFTPLGAPVLASSTYLNRKIRKCWGTGEATENRYAGKNHYQIVVIPTLWVDMFVL